MNTNFIKYLFDRGYFNEHDILLRDEIGVHIKNGNGFFIKQNFDEFLKDFELHEVFSVSEFVEESALRFYVHYTYNNKEYIRKFFTTNISDTIYHYIKKLNDDAKEKLIQYKLGGRYVPVKEYSKLFRQYVKHNFKDYKFSVRKDNNTIHIKLKSGKKPITTDVDLQKDIEQSYSKRFSTREVLSDDIDNHLTSEVNKMLLKIDIFINKFHNDKSEPQIDYFDTNFYYNIDYAGYKTL